MVMRGLLLVLKTNCIRQPKGQLPSSSYNHNNTDNPHNICGSLIWVLTATLKCICNDSFTDVLGAVSVLWL